MNIIKKTLSEKTKRKIGKAMKNRKVTWGNKISKGKKGKRTSIKTEFKKGNKHPNWKGGISSLNEKLRKSLRFKEWREQVFKRDNYTCQNPNCKFCKGILHTHHIVPVAECIQLDYINLIFDVNNGLTLCKQCHSKEPKVILNV